jgi:hypothetical protein
MFGVRFKILYGRGNNPPCATALCLWFPSFIEGLRLSGKAGLEPCTLKRGSIITPGGVIAPMFSRVQGVKAA